MLTPFVTFLVLLVSGFHPPPPPAFIWLCVNCIWALKAITADQPSPESSKTSASHLRCLVHFSVLRSDSFFALLFPPNPFLHSLLRCLFQWSVMHLKPFYWRIPANFTHVKQSVLPSPPSLPFSLLWFLGHWHHCFPDIPPKEKALPVGKDEDDGRIYDNNHQGCLLFYWAFTSCQKLF